MALVASQEVELAISASVHNSDSISRLSDELAAAAKQASGTAAPIRELGDEIAALEKRQNLVEQFSALRIETVQLEGALTGATARVEGLATEMQAAEQASAAAAHAQAEASAKLEEARDHHVSLKGAVRAASAELKQLREEVRASGQASDEQTQKLADTKAQLAILRQESGAAAANVRDLRTAHRESALAAREAGAAESGLVKEYKGAVDNAKALSGQLGTTRRALDTTRDGMRAAGLDVRNLAGEKQRLAATADHLSGRIAHLQSATMPAGRGLKQMARDARETQDGLQGLGSAGDALQVRFGALSQAVAGVFAAGKLKGYVGDMIDVADAYSQMASRIELATSSAEEYDRVQERLLESANRTYRPLAEAQEMFIRTSDALQSLGYDTEQALDVTDSFSYLLTTNAASAEKAGSAISAYTKSIQSGKVEIDSWQSVMAAMPSIIEAVAGATGKSTEEVRKLGVTGKLAIGDLNEGLRQTVEMNKAAADSMPTTVSDALTKLANTWSVYIGEANRAGGATEKLVGVINSVSENLDQLVTVAVRAGEVLTAVFAVKALRAVQGFAAAQLAAAAAVGTLSAAMTAQAAAATNSARATGAWATATGLAVGVGRAAAAPFAAFTASIGASTVAVWAKVRALGALRVALLGTGVGALVVGVGTLLAKFTEGATKAEDMADAVDKAFDAPENKVSPALQLVATDAESARFNLSELQQQFGEVGTSAAGIAEALKTVFNDADLGSVDGIAKLALDIDELEKSAYAAGEQIDTALRQRLAQLTAKELNEFGIMAEMAFNRGQIGAEALARINDQVLAASFDRLGINAAQALGQISPLAQDAIDSVEGLIDQLSRAGVSAERTAVALDAALNTAITKADSAEALTALTTRITEWGQAGKLSGDQVSAALDKIRGKADELTPGINSATEALRALGITSDAELRKTEKAFREAYEAVTGMGGSVREQEAAFRRYAEAAINANSGVADSSLKVRAAMHGLTIDVDSAGRTIVRNFEERAKTAFDVARDASDDLGRSMANLEERAEKLAEGVERVGSGFRNAAKQSTDAQGNVIRAATGYTERGAYERAKSTGLDEATALRLAEEYLKYQKSADSLTRFSEAIDAAVLATARAKAKEKEQSQASSSAERSQNAPQSATVHRVEIRLGSQVTTVATDDAGAQSLEALFTRLEKDAWRASSVGRAF